MKNKLNHAKQSTSSKKYYTNNQTTKFGASTSTSINLDKKQGFTREEVGNNKINEVYTNKLFKCPRFGHFARECPNQRVLSIKEIEAAETCEENPKFEPLEEIVSESE